MRQTFSEMSSEERRMWMESKRQEEDVPSLEEDSRRVRIAANVFLGAITLGAGLFLWFIGTKVIGISFGG